MRVLMITGDRNIFVPGTEAHERFALQKQAVENLEALFWGRGSLFPAIPRGAFDVVTVQDPFWRGLIGWVISLMKKARFNVQVHTNFDAEVSTKPLRRLVAKFVLGKADSVRAVTDRIKDQIQRYTNAPISTLPIFIDVEKARAAPAVDLRKNFPEFSKIILVVARLEPEKNVGAAIDLLPKILVDFPDAGLFIAGSGSEEKKLLEKAGALGLEKRVVFLGFRSDVASLCKGADALLITSKYESYGGVILTALAVGVPVISPDVGVASEAGAYAVPFNELGAALVNTLRQHQKGVLQMKLLSKEAWMDAWPKTL